MGKNTEDYLWATQRAYNLLRADTTYGALAFLSAGGDACERLVEMTVQELKAILGDDALPPSTSTQ